MLSSSFSKYNIDKKPIIIVGTEMRIIVSFLVSMNYRNWFSVLINRLVDGNLGYQWVANERTDCIAIFDYLILRLCLLVVGLKPEYRRLHFCCFEVILLLTHTNIVLLLLNTSHLTKLFCLENQLIVEHKIAWVYA